jgi:hypothetical protein
VAGDRVREGGCSVRSEDATRANYRCKEGMCETERTGTRGAKMSEQPTLPEMPQAGEARAAGAGRTLASLGMSVDCLVSESDRGEGWGEGRSSA